MLDFALHRVPFAPNLFLTISALDLSRLLFSALFPARYLSLMLSSALLASFGGGGDNAFAFGIGECMGCEACNTGLGPL